MTHDSVRHYRRCWPSSTIPIYRQQFMQMSEHLGPTLTKRDRPQPSRHSMALDRRLSPQEHGSWAKVARAHTVLAPRPPHSAERHRTRTVQQEPRAAEPWSSMNSVRRLVHPGGDVSQSIWRTSSPTWEIWRSRKSVPFPAQQRVVITLHRSVEPAYSLPLERRKPAWVLVRRYPPSLAANHGVASARSTMISGLSSIRRRSRAGH